MGRRGAYYSQGFSDGVDAAMDTDWGPGELKDAVERDRLGDVAGEVLSNWQQMAGTIYYDESVTENQLSAWEEGFYAGFASQAEMMAGVKKKRRKARKKRANPHPKSPRLAKLDSIRRGYVDQGWNYDRATDLTIKDAWRLGYSQDEVTKWLGWMAKRATIPYESNPRKRSSKSGKMPPLAKGWTERGWQERAILEIEAAVRSGKLTREEEKRMLKELGIRSNPKGAYSTTFHRDGSITFWSAYQQRWIRARDISDRELAAMSEKERGRVLRHLSRR